MSVLLVLPQLPFPPVHGSAVRMWNLLRVLACEHRVDLLSFHEPNLAPEALAASVREIRRYCGRVRTVPRRPVAFPPSLLDRTLHVEMFDCPDMREALLEVVEERDYDLIQFDKTEMAQYALPEAAPAQVLSEHIIFYHAYRRQFLAPGRASASHLLDYLRLRRYELRALDRFDGIITMSETDARFLRARRPGHRCIAAIPNGVDTDHYRCPSDPPGGHDLLFIGNFHHSPNVDAVRFFLREVFPRVRVSVPEARLLIVGPGPYATLPEVAAEPGAVATGLVDDTRPYLEGCACLVAPILAGSGTRLKILEAMAAGAPVVSTALGAEGIDADPGIHLLVADGARAFAEATVRLLQDPALRQRLRRSARALVEARYDWKAIGRRQEEIYLALARKTSEDRYQTSDVRRRSIPDV